MSAILSRVLYGPIFLPRGSLSAEDHCSRHGRICTWTDVAMPSPHTGHAELCWLSPAPSKNPPSYIAFRVQLRWGGGKKRKIQIKVWVTCLTTEMRRIKNTTRLNVARRPAHSLSEPRLDATQTCLARRRMCLTGGLTEFIFRTATARSEPAAQAAAARNPPPPKKPNLKEQEG